MAGARVYVPFCVRFRHVEYLNDPHVPQTTIRLFDLWYPPTGPDRFVVREESPWYIWEPGRMTVMSPHDQNFIQEIAASTIYWCPDRHDYAVMPFDCTIPDEQATRATNDAHEGRRNQTEADEEDGETDTTEESDFESDFGNTVRRWRRLEFRHVEGFSRQCISLVGYSNENYTLGTAGPSRWFNQLLPSTCDATRSPEYQGECALAGDLTLLVGLCTFTFPPEQAADAVAHCFRPNLMSADFRPHNRFIGQRVERRGLVVIIGYHPAYTTERAILDWQNARGGPILT